MTVTIKLRIATGAHFERFGPFDLEGKRPEQDGSKRRVLGPPTGNATDPNGRCSSINRLISQMSCLSRVTAEPCRIPPATPAEMALSISLDHQRARDIVLYLRIRSLGLKSGSV
ncbi:hypothetical protein MK632_26310 [Rhizobium changzhiense]|uniref:hypothetical protein n=1 Tax=Rhizobium changzhiense TaxID=2692317 RepID=UPI001F0BFA78|nr:hypothetical protein [Rhizobium changzhiense]MCH4549236.1 hypothetical protein [Rhizobium changzhiense]